jgi:hypothetical protein
MKQETEDSIFADIALFFENTAQTIRRVETELLTEMTISKRHLRILIALDSACKTALGKWVHVDLEQMRGLVALRSGKKYSASDIYAFTFDLAKRKYINHVVHEELGNLFAILPQGTELLETVGLLLPDQSEISKTPNFYFGTRH